MTARDHAGIAAGLHGASGPINAGIGPRGRLSGAWPGIAGAVLDVRLMRTFRNEVAD